MAANLEMLNLEKMNYITEKTMNANFNYKVKEFLDFMIADEKISQQNVINYDSINQESTECNIGLDSFLFKIEIENNDFKINYLGKVKIMMKAIMKQMAQYLL